MNSVDLLEPTENVESLNIQGVDLNNLSKEELISLIESHKNASTNYEHTIEEMKKHNEDVMKDITDHYGRVIEEKNRLIGYYERKLKVLRDIITIETGGEK